MELAHILPHVTAGLNGLTAILLIIAFGFIRAKKTAAHRATMISAVIVSGVFLACYLLYHFTAPIFIFTGQGMVRTLYYTLLISHVVLAVAILPLIAITVRRGLGGHTTLHRAIARVTLPLWMYVSLSGLTVYTLLYHVYS